MCRSNQNTNNQKPDHGPEQDHGPEGHDDQSLPSH